MRKTAISILLLSCSLGLFSQSDTTVYIPTPEQQLADSLLIDSLWNLLDREGLEEKTFINEGAFQPGSYLTYSESFEEEDYIPTFTSDDLKSRIENMQGEIPYVYNQYVHNFINVYAVKKRKQVSRMLTDGQHYFPMIEQIFAEEGLPDNLKYMAIIESALIPTAVSRMGATGMWQFMYSTGKEYGLKMNKYVDERRDPEKSTRKAAKYLKNMYKRYQDWYLVIAAYNCGPGNVNRAIRRAGGNTDFWKIRKYLPRETRGYVPAFIAASYVMTYNYEHNIYPGEPSVYEGATYAVQVNQQVSFDKVSKYTEVSDSILTLLNPHIKRKFIPTSESGYDLILPAEQSDLFLVFQDSIYTQSLADQPAQLVSTGRTDPADMSDRVKLYYKIKPGDNLGFIADWYDVGLSQLKRWNGIRGSRITAGKKLIVYVPENQVDYYNKINTMSTAAKNRLDGNSVPNNQVASSQHSAISCDKDDGSYILYKIQPGDTLWVISQRYNHSVDQLKAWNNITNHRSLKPGMCIRVG